MSAPAMASIGPSANSVRVFVPSHQQGSRPVVVPKITYVPPQAGSANGAWKTSGHFLDYELPNSIGVLCKTTLRFNVLKSSSASLIVPPTPFWIQQVEISVGANLIETLYPNDIFNETVGFKSKDELDATNEVLYCNPDNYVAVDSALPTGSSYAYLPFNNCLTTARIFVAGVSETVKMRVYFPPNLFDYPDTTEVSLSDATLIIEEDIGSHTDRSDNETAMKAGIIYGTVVRQRQSSAITKTKDSDYRLELSGINGASAGLMVYVGPVISPGGYKTVNSSPVANNLSLTKRYPLDTLELDDRTGNKRTETLRGESLIAFTWWSAVGTSFPAHPNAFTYLLPFSANFRDAVETGNYQGSLQTNGSDRLVIRGNLTDSGAATETWNITITNYCYMGLVFSNGKLINVVKNPNSNPGR